VSPESAEFAAGCDGAECIAKVRLDMSEFLSIAEVDRLLRAKGVPISKKTLYDLVSTGKLRGRKALGTRRVMIESADLQRYLESGK
jgi:excisionase family DNA binding protein